MNIKIIFQKWPSPYISWQKLCELTGGMINHKTLRNLDSKGEGIPGKMRVSSNCVVYPVENAKTWLNERIKKWNTKGGSHE